MKIFSNALRRVVAVRFSVLMVLAISAVTVMLPQKAFAVTATLSAARASFTLNRIRPNQITSGGNSSQQTVDFGLSSRQSLNASWQLTLSPVDPGVNTAFNRRRGFVWRLRFPNNNANGWTAVADPVLGPTGDYYVTYSIDGTPGRLSSIDGGFPDAEAGIIMQTTNLRLRRRNNGRLRDIRGGIRFTLGLDNETNAAGFYSGDIRIEITSPNGSITIN